MIEVLVVEQLAWNEWTREHIAKHDVVPEEVAEVLAGCPVVRRSYKNRFAAIGPTRAGRMLAVVIGPDPIVPGLYYTFSARPASRRERRIFMEESTLEEST